MKKPKKIIKKTLKYRVILLPHTGIDVDVENKIDKIEFSNIKVHGNFHVGDANRIRENLLLRYIPQYSNYNIGIKSERSKLAGYYQNEIGKLLDKIEEYKLVVQLCSKNRVAIKEDK